MVADIRANAQITVESEKILMSKFASLSQKESERLTAGLRNRMTKAKKRLVELDNLITSAFEEKVKGNTPDRIFKQMLQKYETEQNDLNAEKS